MRDVLVGIGLLLLVGCGVSETAVTSAAVADAKTREAETARQTQERINKELEAATLQGQQRLKNAEAAGN
jgi:type IV pilus biogenesis protein CpaD/CtpE